GEEELLRRGVDHLDGHVRARSEPVWPQQDVVDGLGEPEAHEEGDEDRKQRPHEPPPELDQVLDQRRLARFDVVLGHGAGPAPLLARFAAVLACVLAFDAARLRGAFAAGFASPGLGAAGGAAGPSTTRGRSSGAFSLSARVSVRTLSIACFTSSSSASRMASSNWRRNSAAARRSLPA